MHSASNVYAAAAKCKLNQDVVVRTSSANGKAEKALRSENVLFRRSRTHEFRVTFSFSAGIRTYLCLFRQQLPWQKGLPSACRLYEATQIYSQDDVRRAFAGSVRS